MNRQLKVILWNANGVITRKNELQVFATDTDADVILLTETHLQPDTNFNVTGYQTYRNDRRPRLLDRRNPGGGTAVLVHRRLTHRPVATNTPYESTGIAIRAGDTELTIFSVYQSPAAPFPPDSLGALLDTDGPVFIGGDFNAKHQTWHCRSTNRRGRSLREYLDRRGDTTVLSTVDPTYYSPTINHAPDVLDIFLVKDCTFQVDLVAAEELSSDHLPVVATLATAPTTRLPPHGLMRTDWGHYSIELEQRLRPLGPAETTNELDLQVSRLQAEIAGALGAASRPAPHPAGPRPLPADLRHEIGEKNRLRRAWQRTRNPRTKRAFNQQCDLVKRALYAYRTETWNNYLGDLDLEHGGAWRAAKLMRGEKTTVQPLHGQRGVVYTADDRAETFADTMEDQFSPHADVYDDDHIDLVEEAVDTYFSADPAEQLPPVTAEEVQTQIDRAKVRKAPGIDGISARALRSAPYVLILCLVSVFNSALRLRHFPSCWKEAKVILIPKPGKSRQFPENFRPISLLPILSKMFERLFLARISPFLEDFIRPEQFGFRKGHSTVQQIVRVVNMLVDNANLNLCSAGVLLDVSKAFDKVWHDGLLYKLIESPVPDAAVHLLRSYLTGRSFKTCVEGQLSTTRGIEAGVPQGSVLGPVLYLVYTNDMPVVPRVTLSLYADDALFVCRSATPTQAAIYLQRQLDALQPWLEKWRILVNASKSKAIVFRKRRRMPRARPQRVSLDDEDIEWTDEVKYLGVTLDSRLNFKAHYTRKLDEVKRLSGALSPLIGRRSVLPTNIKITLFLQIARSVMMYASTAWWAMLCRTSRNRLESAQNKALRAISKQPWYVRNATIRNAYKIQTLDEYATAAAGRFFRVAADSGKEHIRQIAVRYDVEEDYRKRPVSILDAPDE